MLGGQTHISLGSLSSASKNKNSPFFITPSRKKKKKTKLLLAAASQGLEPQQLIQEAKGDIDGGEGPRWRGEERE